MSTNTVLTPCKVRYFHVTPSPFNENKDLGKYLGKIFAHNSHDFLCVRYEIRQTYAVCLILLFIQRFADVMLSVAIHLAMCSGGFICWSCFELFGLKDYVLHHILVLVC